MFTKLTRLAPCLLLTLFLFSLSTPSAIATENDTYMEDIKQYADLLDHNIPAGQQVATKMAELTGVAISPLFGLCVIGGLEMLNTPKDKIHTLPWYNSPQFLIPVFILLLLITFKDTVGEVLGPLKAPLDYVDAAHLQIAGLIGYGAMLPTFINTIQQTMEQSLNTALYELAPVATAWAATASTAGPGAGGGVLEMIATACAAILGTVAFVIIFLATNAVNMLMLIAPFPFLGFVLKSIRMAVFSLLTIATVVHPYLGVALCLIIIYVSYRIGGWSFRLMVYASVFSLDTILRRKHWTSVQAGDSVKAFSGPSLPQVKNRCYGRLSLEQNKLIFRYRPWVILPSRKIILHDAPATYRVGRAFTGPCIMTRGEAGSLLTKIQLPPRYKGDEQNLTGTFKLHPTVEDVGLNKGFKAMFSWLREQSPNEDMPARA